jgi:hypothetical protein
MKAPFSIALLAIVCCIPVFAYGTESTQAKDTATATRAAGSVVNASRPSDSLPKGATAAPMVGPCSLGDPAFSHCLQANAPAMVKQPDDRAVQVFRFSIRTSDGSLTRRTILATVDTSEADAEKMALDDVPGGTVEDRL